MVILPKVRNRRTLPKVLDFVESKNKKENWEMSQCGYQLSNIGSGGGGRREGGPRKCTNPLRIFGSVVVRATD